MLDIKRFLRRKPTSSSASTTTTSSSPASTPTIDPPLPPPEDNQQRDPPPYSPSSSGRPQNGVAQQELLDPTLNFTAAQMEQQWLIKDRAFARAVVQFIAERFDGREKGWGGYKYTYICDVNATVNGANELMVERESASERKCMGRYSWV